MNPRVRATARRYRIVGGTCGLAWAAALRGWMAQLAAGMPHSQSHVTWLTLALVLAPGVMVGALLGQAAYRRDAGLPASRKLILAPVVLGSALLDPHLLVALVRNGTGGGSLIVVATAMCSGFALSRRDWSPSRATSALVAALGLLVLGAMGTMAAPISTAHGAWVCLYGLTLVMLLCLASVLPYQPVRVPAGPMSWGALGALCGLAWACSLRGFMTAVAGPSSEVTWGGTFGYVLLPGAVIGALLGWAEFLRRTHAGPARHLLAYAPLLFSAVLVPGFFRSGPFLQGGVGGGAIGVPVLAMLGGFAISGRGAVWGRTVAGILFTSGFVVWLATAESVGGASFSLDTAHGLWVSALFESLLVTFAMAASAPHDRSRHDLAGEDTSARTRPRTWSE